MFKENVLVFDIETVADSENYKKINKLDCSDEEAVQLMQAERLAETGSTFLRPQQQKIVAISVALWTPQWFKVWSLGEPDSTEPDLIERFFQGIDRFLPTLVSWNGSNFDLPVLHYRALLHGVQAKAYFETGDNRDPRYKDFRYNNYLGRYHWRHTDLMDVLANFNPKNYVGMDELAKLCGFPGKIDMDGSGVQERFNNGDLVSIRNYCETDVLNTYLLYLRFALMRGQVDKMGYEVLINQVKEHLKHQSASHWQEFLTQWG